MPSSNNELNGRTVIGCAAAFIGVIALFLLSIIGYFLVTGGREMQRQARQMSTAVEVEAKIISSELVRSVHSTGSGGSRREFFTPEIVYTFKIDERSHRGEQIYPVPGGGDETWARRTTTRYRPGGVVRAWVDPERPEEAFLERRWVFGPYGLILAGSIGFGILMTMATAVTFFWPSVSRVTAVAGAGAWLLGPMYAGLHYWANPFGDMNEPAGSELPGPGVLAILATVILVTAPIPLLAWMQGRRWQRKMTSDAPATTDVRHDEPL